MAVLGAWRRQGVGSALLRAALDTAREAGLGAVFLHAQVHALAFYAGHGFIAVGPVFDDAGIAHRTMRRAFKPSA
jgi:predicted GNAT family N-acyltransferase